MLPDLSRVSPQFHKYIGLVHEPDADRAFETHSASLFSFLRSIPEKKYDHAYAPGKWTIRESVQHLIDTERVFAYRALSFSRNDQTPLPGFDENNWAASTPAAQRDWDRLLLEFSLLRKSTELMFATFTQAQLEAPGTASGNPNYVLALGYAIIGHAKHHENIIRERYLG